MVKKLVNGQDKDLTDVTIGGIKVYCCAKQENNHNRSDDTGSHNRIDSRGDISNDTSNVKNDSTLGAMSLFS